MVEAGRVFGNRSARQLGPPTHAPTLSLCLLVLWLWIHYSLQHEIVVVIYTADEMECTEFPKTSTKLTLFPMWTASIPSTVCPYPGGGPEFSIYC